MKNSEKKSVLTYLLKANMSERFDKNQQK